MTQSILDVEDIMKLIPHRYPFLLIDKIVKVEENKTAVAIKNVTFNDQFFQGHFPGHPVMPGVLIVEALAQTASVLGALSVSEDERKNKVVYFFSINNVKFRKPVKPGDVLRLEVEKVHGKPSAWKFKGKAYVEDDLVTQADFLAGIVDK